MYKIDIMQLCKTAKLHFLFELILRGVAENCSGDFGPKLIKSVWSQVRGFSSDIIITICSARRGKVAAVEYGTVGGCICVSA